MSGPVIVPAAAGSYRLKLTFLEQKHQPPSVHVKRQLIVAWEIIEGEGSKPVVGEFFNLGVLEDDDLTALQTPDSISNGISEYSCIEEWVSATLDFGWDNEACYENAHCCGKQLDLSRWKTAGVA